MSRLAFVILVLKEVLARELLARSHDARDAPVADLEPPFLARLTTKLESHLGAGERDVPILQGCEAEALVGPGVFAISDPDQRRLEKVDDGGQDFGASEPALGHMAGNRLANARQVPAEGEEPVVFCLVANGLPVLMVAILLSASPVATGRLDVAVGGRTDPDVGPCRRNGEPAYPRQDRPVLDGIS